MSGINERKRKGTGNEEVGPWNIKLKEVIDEVSSPAELRALLNDLKSFIVITQSKLLSISDKIEDLVILVDSNQTQNQDLSFNRSSREVDATLSVGPKRKALSLSLSNNTNTEGSNDIRVESDLFLLEEDEFEGPNQATLQEFFNAAGISNFKSSRYDGSDTFKAMLWYLGDVIRQGVILLLQKYGERDEYGVELGFDKDAIYSYLERVKN